MTEEMKNCSYCSEGALLDAFGIKIGELPMSKVILFKEQSHKGRIIVACKKHVDDITQLTKEERIRKVVAYQRKYYAAHPDKYEERKAKERERQRRKRAEQKAVMMAAVMA